VKLIRYGRLAAILAAGALTATACGSDPVPSTPGGQTGSATQSGLSGSLAAGGASSQESAMQAWIAGFQEANPDVTVSYDAVGSGAGRTQFLEGAFPFAGSDAPMDEEEQQQSVERCGGQPAMHLPLYISRIAVIYNLPGVTGLQLSPGTLARIFDQKIKNWNDPAIAADNPGVTLPNQAISPVNRSDESGTTENFTEYLAATAADAWPHEPSGDWPVPGGQSGQGTSGVVQTVQGGNGAIGYADASKAGSLGVAKIKVGEAFVEPSSEAAAKVVDASPRAAGAAEHDIRIELARETTEQGAYPIVLIAYEILCQNYDEAGEGELVKAFLSYVASEDGQAKAAEAAGSAPISDSLRSDVEAALDTVTTGS
jgi:phosphate transport system substrate-binding protein